MKSKKQRLMIATAMAFAFVFGFVENVSAMHIMEGYLPLNYCVLWGVLCIPFLVAGVLSIKKIVDQNRKTLLILVMMGAYAFVLSALKIPSVTGSSSHPTGTGLGAILFGPTAMCVIGIIVLLFQAILLAHGGLTTLGANTFSMAIAGTVSRLRDLYPMQKRKHLKIRGSISCHKLKRSIYILCDRISACLGASFRGWRLSSLFRRISGDICCHPGSAGSD